MEFQRKERGWSWYVGIIFIIFFVLLYFQLISDKLSYLRGGDTASYILLAKSLASGLGFSDFNLPGNPPHTQYPPLFPLMLTPIVAFFGYNFMWMRLVGIAFALAALYVIKLYFTRRTSSAMAYVLVFLTGTSFFVLSISAEILPEAAYLFISILTLYLYEKNMDKTFASPYARYLPVLAPLMYFTKFIGVTICFAVICVLLLRIKSEAEERSAYIKKLLYFILIGVVPFVVWFVRNNLYARGVSTYQSIMFQADYYDSGLGSAGVGAIFDRMIANITMYINEVPMTFLTYLDLRKAVSPAVLKGFLAVILILFLIGFIRDLIIKRGIKDFYTFFYLAILMVWPTYGSGDALRYLVPLIPLFYYYFFRGFEVVISPGTFFTRGEVGLAALSGKGSRQAW
ncbi:MAG: glycosyltransferase family 39 protein, partial [Proteobacteria bacterium]|nr:glycosyltransferase family 39 protein [Pseudomonadota bacterium]